MEDDFEILINFTSVHSSPEEAVWTAVKDGYCRYWLVKGVDAIIYVYTEDELDDKFANGDFKRIN